MYQHDPGLGDGCRGGGGLEPSRDADGPRARRLRLADTTLFFLDRARREGVSAAYPVYRKSLGRAILLGLEFLVAADIVRTVAITPTFTDVGVLGAIVLIRTFLSIPLQVETEARLAVATSRGPQTPAAGI